MPRSAAARAASCIGCLLSLAPGLLAATFGSEVTKAAKTTKGESCGYLVAKVVHSIKYHLAKRHGNHGFISEPEARLYSNLEDNENGREILTNTMRVLGNYTLDEGLKAGTLWTIEDQNRYISCEQNIDTRLEEHTRNEYGDALLQGDMAVTTSLCHYSEQSSKVSNTFFAVGTKNCLGVHGCQFAHPDEAIHFCNTEPECTMVMGKADDAGCDGGLGCYMPKKGAPVDDETWHANGGRTYMKHCPGALLQLQSAMEQGLREAGNRWRNGEIAYCFTAEVSDVAQEAFHIAVERIKKQVPCLNFQLADRINDTHCNTQPSIIVASRPTGCWSYIGQVSGREKGWHTRSQPLNLDRGCEMVGMALHQLGHALGMLHQNSRGDRAKVMRMNASNIKAGKEMEFQMSQDVVKYAWDGYDSCSTRAGRTRVAMTTADCLAVKGYFEGGGGGDDDLVQCQLDLCEDGKYFPAPTNKCSERVAQISLKMERKDCHRAQGTPATAGEMWEWTDCHFDLCKDMGLHLAKPFACGNKLAYGYIQTPSHDCENLEGSLSASHAGMAWVNCYFDFCSGEFDAPFDYLSLMMYSPYAWSKNPNQDMTLEPLGNHSGIISQMMGQRMGFSGLDVFHLGHMYNCWDQIKPDFDSKNVSRKIISGEYFEYEHRCEDVQPEQTGFDIHGETGFMKPAPCDELSQHCWNASIGEKVREACPVSCYVCMPDHGLTRAEGEGGSCFDAVNTGIRFRDGPKATCHDLVNYCNHSTIGAQVKEACKLTCGLCDLHVEAPFVDAWGNCKDFTIKEEPQFTIGGVLADCSDMAEYCQDHVDSYIVRRKCPLTCGVCSEDNPPVNHMPESNEIHIPGDTGGCGRRRRWGFCSTRRRRNV